MCDNLFFVFEIGLLPCVAGCDMLRDIVVENDYESYLLRVLFIGLVL